MNVLTRLRLERDGLTESERSLADVILAGPERCLGEGAKQLARRASVSQATVYRLCEKLGCSGLADLRVRLARALEAYRHEDAGVDVNFPVRAGQDGRAVVDGLARDLAQTLAATANVLDAVALDRAAEIVLGALFARCFVEDFDANLARRLAYYEGIVALGGCSGSGR